MLLSSTARARLAMAAAGAALAAAQGCDSPRPGACPGEAIRSLRFSAELSPTGPGTCPPPANPSLSFTAALAFGPGPGVALCPDRPDAVPLAGTHTGDHLLVTTRETDANLPGCTCMVRVVESLEGDVVRDGGAVVGFSGQLRNVITPPSGTASCEPQGGGPNGGAKCGAPCELRWTVVGS